MGPISRLLGGVLIIGAGVGAIVLAANAPKLLRAARPVVRQGLKRGLEAYATVRSAVADFSDDVEDLVAEVQAELKQGRGASEQPPNEAKQA